MTDKNKKWLTYIGIFIAVISLGLAGVLVKLAQQYASPLSAAFLRTTVATLILAPFIFRPGWRKRLTFARKELLLSAAAGVFLALHFWCWFDSLNYTFIANSMTLLNTQPIIAVVLSYLFLREKISKEALLAILIAMVGVVILGMGDKSSSKPDAFYGDTLAFGAAATSCIYLMIARVVRQKHDLIPYIFVVYGCSAITLLIITLAHQQPLLGHDPTWWLALWVVVMAVGPTLFGHTAINWAVKYLPVYVVTLFLLIELVLSAISGKMVFDEEPLSSLYYGAAFIFVALFLTARNEHLKRKKQNTETQ